MFHACLTIHDGSEVECSTWVEMVAEHHFATNCSLCPAGPIEFCATQNNDKCMECVAGYSVTATQDVCLKDACTQPWNPMLTESASSLLRIALLVIPQLLHLVM